MLAFLCLPAPRTLLIPSLSSTSSLQPFLYVCALVEADTRVLHT